MKTLLNLFLDLCLLRAAPQDIPAAPILLWFTALLNILTNILILFADLKRTPLQIMGESIFDVVILFSTLHIALYWQNLESRFNQTATAIFGSNVLLGLVVVIINNGGGGGEGIIGEIWLLLLLSLMVWQFLVLGHILRHTFEISLSPAIIAGIIYTLLSYAVLELIFQ